MGEVVYLANKYAATAAGRTRRRPPAISCQLSIVFCNTYCSLCISNLNIIVFLWGRFIFFCFWIFWFSNIFCSFVSCLFNYIKTSNYD